MVPRPAFLIPFLVLLSAATTACGSASAGTSAAPSATPTSAMSPSGAKAHRVAAPSPKTVTVTVTKAPPAQPVVQPAATNTSAPTASAPSFPAFAGDWTGHTKFVSVSRTGRLEEHVGDGCCHPVIDMVIQLSNPHRVGATWVANGRVVSAKVHDGWDSAQAAPTRGDSAVVRVGADHILRESITGYAFCDPEKTAPGTCGA